MESVVIGKVKLVIAIAAAAWIATAGWEVSASEIANVSLQDDMRDLASQAGTRIGLTTAKTDDDFRDAVVRKAKEHGIPLDPGQVTVQRSGPAEKSVIDLAASYDARICAVVCLLSLHFNPTSGNAPRSPT